MVNSDGSISFELTGTLGLSAGQRDRRSRPRQTGLGARPGANRTREQYRAVGEAEMREERRVASAEMSQDAGTRRCVVSGVGDSGEAIMSKARGPVISPMIVVGDGRAAIEFYEAALGARVRWVLGDGQVACLDVDGAPLLLSEENPANDTLTPATAGAMTTRIELFVDDPDAVIARAVAAGAVGGHMESRPRPWGEHRQGGFVDPWGQPWLVGDRGPIESTPEP